MMPSDFQFLHIVFKIIWDRSKDKWYQIYQQVQQFFSSLARFKFLPVFSFSFIIILWST